MELEENTDSFAKLTPSCDHLQEAIIGVLRGPLSVDSGNFDVHADKVEVAHVEVRDHLALGTALLFGVLPVMLVGLRLNFHVIAIFAI